MHRRPKVREAKLPNEAFTLNWETRSTKLPCPALRFSNRLVELSADLLLTVGQTEVPQSVNVDADVT